jgi:alanine racemase
MSSLVWIEIDSGAPDANLRELAGCAGGPITVCAVVKSNAYGHGLREIAGLLPSADWFAVNSLDEGLELRELGHDRPVLVLGHVPLSGLGDAVDAGLKLTVYNRETLEVLSSEASARGVTADVHVKVETGTWRQGVLPEEVPAFFAEASSRPGIRLEGLSTHFANIEDTLSHDYAEGQLRVFNGVLDRLGSEGISVPVVHTACTAATILFPETHFSMLRTGIGLYGLWPSRETFLSARMSGRRMPRLRPVLTWKTRIAQVKSVPEGAFIGYGCTYRTTRPSRIAVLPVGYADGYDRAIGNSGHVLVRGRRAPVTGRVCMNLTMVDITDVEGARLEDEVVLLGRDGEEEITAEAMAGWAGTIGYEIVTRISPFLPRVVVDRGIGSTGG